EAALDIIANNLNAAKKRWGPESVVFALGALKGFRAYVVRLANVFGTPNVIFPDHVCFIPRVMGSVITCGFPATADVEYPPGCITVWGCNSAATDLPQWIRLKRALAQGSRLIVVDPKQTELASMADLWIQLRPGSDLALALAMINVIITEELYDKAFVRDWTVGFEELKKHVRDYAPEKIEKITWVPAGMIAEAARLYARTRPACIHDGNAIEDNINSVQTARAISILRAITGNLDVPGGDIELGPLPTTNHNFGPSELTLEDQLTEEQRQKRIGADSRFAPIPLAQFALPQLVVKAILEGDPYPVKVMSIHGSNPLVTYSNAGETYRALQKLDFLAVSDIIMTPTAELADIVLPATTYLELNDVAPRMPHVQVRQKVAQIGECWPDRKIINELAKRLGLGQYFWECDEEALDVILKPAGLTFDEFRKQRILTVEKRFRKYRKKDFNTPSKKVELYSSRFEQWGYDPLPTYQEPPETPYSAPELAKEYPLILTSWHQANFRHSESRHLTSLRGISPEPVVEIHPETARNLEIEDGEWVYIETKRGRIKQRAVLTTMVDQRVVGASYAWWFPEKGSAELYGWQEANFNILTDSRPPYNAQIGSTQLRGILCRVYKAGDE
ncbi:molybdopterin-dependent oxidoreductase, partial [Chloroflexota bacterium]